MFEVQHMNFIHCVMCHSSCFMPSFVRQLRAFAIFFLQCYFFLAYDNDRGKNSLLLVGQMRGNGVNLLRGLNL